MPKLIGTLGSPFVRKVRMVLAEKNIPYLMIENSPSQQGSIVPTVNPLGKVPAMLTDDERSLYDSRVIVEYLDTLHPDNPLLPPVGMARISVKRWEALADGLSDATVAVVSERRRENELQRSPEWIAKQMGKVQRAVTTLAEEIGDREWCHGDHLTLADLAVMAALGYVTLRLPEMDWRSEFPNLHAYFVRHAQRQSFIDTTPPAT